MMRAEEELIEEQKNWYYPIVIQCQECDAQSPPTKLGRIGWLNTGRIEPCGMIGHHSDVRKIGSNHWGYCPECRAKK